MIHGPEMTVRDQRAKITEPGVKKAVAAGLSGGRGRRVLSSSRGPRDVVPFLGMPL